MKRSKAKDEEGQRTSMAASARIPRTTPGSFGVLMHCRIYAFTRALLAHLGVP